MGWHHSWRKRAALAIVLGGLTLAAPPLSSQEPPSGSPVPAPPPPPEPPPLPRIIRMPELIGSRTEVVVRRPRRLADMTMVAPTDNPMTEAKAALGRRLFFDACCPNDRSVSCATCHDPERAFTDERTLAVGVFGRVGKRHSPSLVNRGFGRSQFWDGRAATLEAQVVQPIPRSERDGPLARRRRGAPDGRRVVSHSVSGRVRAARLDRGPRARPGDLSPHDSIGRLALRSVRRRATRGRADGRNSSLACRSSGRRGGAPSAISSRRSPTRVSEHGRRLACRSGDAPPAPIRTRAGSTSPASNAIAASSRSRRSARSRARPLHARRQPGDPYGRRRVLQRRRPSEPQPLPCRPAAWPDA